MEEVETISKSVCMSNNTVDIMICFIVFNLANGVDVEGTKRKMNLYKKENQTLILKNRERQVRLVVLRSRPLPSAALDVLHHQHAPFWVLVMQYCTSEWSRSGD